MHLVAKPMSTVSKTGQIKNSGLEVPKYPKNIARVQNCPEITINFDFLILGQNGRAVRMVRVGRLVGVIRMVRVAWNWKYLLYCQSSKKHRKSAKLSFSPFVLLSFCLFVQTSL